MADVTKRNVRANIFLTRNELTLYDQEYVKSDVDFDQSTNQRVVLATNMATPSELDLGNITTGAALMLKTDREITFALNTTSNTINIADNGMVQIVGEFTAVYVQNSSTTYTATIDFVATD